MMPVLNKLNRLEAIESCPDSPKSTHSLDDFRVPLKPDNSENMIPVVSKPSSSKIRENVKIEKQLGQIKRTPRRCDVDRTTGIGRLSYHWFCMDTKLKVLQTYPKNVSLFSKFNINPSFFMQVYKPPVQNKKQSEIIIIIICSFRRWLALQCAKSCFIKVVLTKNA
jgi:hypothetical protein